MNFDADSEWGKSVLFFNDLKNNGKVEKCCGCGEMPKILKKNIKTYFIACAYYPYSHDCLFSTSEASESIEECIANWNSVHSEEAQHLREGLIDDMDSLIFVASAER